MNKESFILYTSFYKPIRKLTDEQLGRLFRAIYIYQLEGVEEVDEDIEIAFAFFVNQFEIDTRKYQERVRRNRENGRKGGTAKAQKRTDGDDGLREEGLVESDNSTVRSEGDGERRRSLRSQANATKDASEKGGGTKRGVTTEGGLSGTIAAMGGARGEEMRDRAVAGGAARGDPGTERVLSAAETAETGAGKCRPTQVYLHISHK